MLPKISFQWSYFLGSQGAIHIHQQLSFYQPCKINLGVPKFILGGVPNPITSLWTCVVEQSVIWFNGQLNVFILPQTSHYSANKVVDPDWKLYPCSILPSGMVIWTPSAAFSSSCDLNMYKFPFDKQRCSLNFGNLVHRESAVQLYASTDSVQLAFYVPSKEFM